MGASEKLNEPYIGLYFTEWGICALIYPRRHIILRVIICKIMSSALEQRGTCEKSMSRKTRLFLIILGAINISVMRSHGRWLWIEIAKRPPFSPPCQRAQIYRPPSDRKVITLLFGFCRMFYDLCMRLCF